MTVRPANFNDIDLLVNLRFDYFKTEDAEFSADKKVQIESQLRRYYPAHLSRDFFAALAEDDNGAVASAAFLVISERPANLSFPTGKVGLILNVFTYSEYRRKGCATGVLNLLIEEAKKQDLSYIELSSSELGKPLYKRLGFKQASASHFTPMKLSLL